MRANGKNANWFTKTAGQGWQTEHNAHCNECVLTTSEERGFTASHCVLLPEKLSDRAVRRYVESEIRREEQATGTPVYAGLYAAGRGRKLLVMSASAGAALGPSICKHYGDQQDFLWLEQLPGGWVWCLVRLGIPLAEGIGASQEDICEALGRQQGSLTVNSSERKVKPWLAAAAPEDLNLHWLWLETGAWNSLYPQLQLQTAPALRRHMQSGLWRKMAMALALIPTSLAGILWLLYEHTDGFGKGTSPLRPALNERSNELPNEHRRPSRPAPAARTYPVGLPVGTTMRQCHQLLMALWSRGAGAISLRLHSSDSTLVLELQVAGTHAQSLAAITAWADRQQLRIEAKKTGLRLLLQPHTAALAAKSDSTAHIPAIGRDGAHPAWLLWFPKTLPANTLLTALQLEAGARWRINSLSGTLHGS